MEQLRSLIADGLQYLQAASPREKRLMALAGGGLLVFILLVGYAGFSRAIGRNLETLDEKRADFEKVERLAANFRAQEMERQGLEQRLRASPPALMSFVDGLAKQEQIDISGMSDRGVVSGGTAGKPRETQIEVNLGKVPLDKLMRLLQAIERSQGVVRVRRLRLRKAYDNKETLDVNLTVSTWQGA
jgi:type II secretory pathway component PulM